MMRSTFGPRHIAPSGLGVVALPHHRASPSVQGLGPFGANPPTPPEADAVDEQKKI